MFVWTVMICLFAGTGYSRGNDELKKYYNDAAIRVKAADSPAEKRQILQTALTRMSHALDEVRSSPLVPEADRQAVRLYQASVQEKQNELSGAAGYVRVADNQLDAFAEYTVQESEQADQVVTISITTLLLILILVIVLVK